MDLIENAPRSGHLLGRARGSSLRAAVVVLVVVLALLAGGVAALWSRGGRHPPAAEPQEERTQLPWRPACPAGTTPYLPGPAGQPRPSASSVEGGWAADAGSLALATRTGRLVLLGGDGTWTFDLCTNRWRPSRAPLSPPAPRLVVSLAYDAESDLVVAVDGRAGWVWAYDVSHDAWVPKRPPPRTLVGGSAVYDPLADLLVFPTPGNVATYDVDSDSWDVRAATGGDDLAAASTHGFETTYAPTVDRVVAYTADARGRNRTWLLDPRAARWEELPIVTPPADLLSLPRGGSMALDDMTKRSVLFSTGELIAFDATGRTWSRLASRPPFNAPPGAFTWLMRWPSPQVFYDPWNLRLVVLGGFVGGEEPRRHADAVWSYDVPSQSWRLLLPAS